MRHVRTPQLLSATPSRGSAVTLQLKDSHALAVISRDSGNSGVPGGTQPTVTDRIIIEFADQQNADVATIMWLP